MQLTSEQLKTYEDQGYLLFPNYLSPAEVEVMKAEAADIYSKEFPGTVLEKDGKTVRLIHGAHFENGVFQRLAHHPKIVKPARQILESSVYIHHLNVIYKDAFSNTMWQWHQDYSYFGIDDGIPTARMACAIVFLDDVNDFNGPTWLIPGSYKEGLIRSFAPAEEQHSPHRGLKYAIDRETVARLVDKYGIVAAKGPAGSVLFFHPNCIHGSAPNIMSPFDRTIVLISYNSVENVPVAVENPRAEFLSNRNHRPIEPLSEDVLLELETGSIPILQK